MIILISPAKTLDFSPNKLKQDSKAMFPEETQLLVKALKKKSGSALKKLMKVSDKIAKENLHRYKEFADEFTSENSKQAILAFKGDVYIGMHNETLSAADLKFAQKHVRILSGLYGILRPLDRIQPYRLEMGTKLKIRRANNLYQFWGDKITDSINSENSDWILNLASKEYFRSVKTSKLNTKVVDVNFKEYHNGELKFISFNAKKARGILTRYAIDNKITSIEGIKAFNAEGYGLDMGNTSDNSLQFIR